MILPARQERGVVVFKVLPGLAYELRLAIAFSILFAGILVQLIAAHPEMGWVFLGMGNLLLLVSGYHNRVSNTGYAADATWERSTLDRLDEIERLVRRMKRWDESALDITSPVGGVIFLFLAAGLVAIAYFVAGSPRILAIDAAILFLPHFVTGTRRILTAPKLMLKIQNVQNVIDANREALSKHRVVPLFLMRGTDKPLPQDLKFRVDIEGKHEDFLGLQGQVVLNDVQGTSYPYFYVVLVAREGFGLHRAEKSYDPPQKVHVDFKVEDGVEVLVLRQFTTKRSGYHCKPSMARLLLHEGIRLAETYAPGVPTEQ